jgi:lipopolysaccharide transport system permease protein
MSRESTGVPVVVHGPGSEVRQPWNFLRAMIHDLLASRQLAWRLARRDISAAYRPSLLGYAWALLPPTFTAGIWIFLSSQRIVQFSPTTVPYAVYALLGTILWQTFADAVSSPLRATLQARAVVARVNFPREAIVLAGLVQVAFSFTVRGLLVLGILAWYRLLPGVEAVFLPLAVAGMVLLGLAAGLFLTPFGMLYTDVQKGLPLVLTAWMYCTPVVYPPPQHGLAAILVDLNPMSPFIVVGRELLTGQPVSLAAPVIVVTILAAVAVFAGWILYRVSMPFVIERAGA